MSMNGSSARGADLIEALDKHLAQNASTLSTNSAFEHYYGTRRTPFVARTSAAHASSSGAPTGASSDGAADVKSVVKARGKRVTQVKDEVEYAPRLFRQHAIA